MIDSGPAALAVRGPNVIINELMINPHKVYDSRGEWIELYNAGDEATNLAGWTLGDDVHNTLVLPSLDIAAGQYLVLAREGDSFANGGVSPRFVYGNSIVLSETNDRLILRDAGSTERDRVDWSSGFTVPDGASISFVRPHVGQQQGLEVVHFGLGDAPR